MLDSVTLSESAVAILRFRGKGRRLPASERNRESFRELVSAGIMEPDGEDFRFTESGRAEWREIVNRESDRIERARHPIPDDVVLSDPAIALLRLCVEREIPEGDDANRPAFRELVKVNLLMPVGSFTKGDECVFRFTYLGRLRAIEFLGLVKEGS
jgi:hypothetical protein